MEQKLSAKKLLQAITEMKEISKMDFLLFSKKGKFIVGTTDIPEKDLADSVALYAESQVESQVVHDWLFLRVEIDGVTEYVLLTNRMSGALGDEIYVIGRMAVCQLRNMYLSIQEPLDQTHFLRQLLNGEIPENKIEEKNYQLHLKSGQFQIYVIRFAKENDLIVAETIKNMFVVNHMDYFVEIDETRAVLVKNISDIPEQDFGQYAHIIVDNVQAEAMTNVWVGYADMVDSFKKMPSAYRNACMALNIGMRFYGEDHVFYYNQMGIGRLIYQLPEDVCMLFLDEVLGENALTEFDEETTTTINHLFDNDLNISETARQLYIHRNTLVYRLERIEKKIGLDIRAFEDAMLFKIAMMVRLHLKDIQNQK